MKTLNLHFPNIHLGARGYTLPPRWMPLRRWMWPPWTSDDCGSDPQHPYTRHNLRWFRLDGVFAHASEAIVLAYLPLFVLALGANRAQIGAMSALSSLSAALLLLPGATLVERWGHRKALCLLGGGGAARVVLLLLALVPAALSGPLAIWIVIALVVFRSAFANLSVPAWMSLTADIVPLSCRGRYFSSRNIAMGVAGMMVTFIVGQLITRVGAPEGHQLALGIAFVIGIVSTLSFSRIREPCETVSQPKTHPGPQSSILPLGGLRAHPDFLAFCAVALLWNGALGIASPFFGVYMVESLGASAGTVGMLGVISAMAALPGQRLFGTLADRWGPRRIQLVTGLIIPLVPWGWALARSPWHLVPIDLVAGFVWAGYSLASFNFLLLLAPEERRSRYTALYQIAVMVALASGSALGGVVATAWGIRAVFVLSGMARLAAALLFVRLVRQPRDEQQTRYSAPRRKTRHKRQRFGALP